MGVELRKATRADCESLALRMRAADALEAKRSSGLGPLDVLLRSCEASDGGGGTLLIGGEIAALYGLVKDDIISHVAVPWLLTSDVVERHRLTFLRIAKVVVDRWSEKNPVLVQMVDDQYEGAKIFLRALGFKIYPPVPHGVARALFCPALRTKHHV
jgi:hypothetical protein